MDEAISRVSTPDLMDQITELAGHLNAAQARWLALIAEFDRRKAWAEWGVKSCGRAYCPRHFVSRVFLIIR